MDLRARQTVKMSHIQSQENSLSIRYKAAPGKSALPLANATRRPVLGDIKNVPLQAPSLVGKIALDLEKKAVIENRPVTRSSEKSTTDDSFLFRNKNKNYKNVLPKVNTGLSSANLIPTARPPIRPVERDESSFFTNKSSSALSLRNVKPSKSRSKENIAPSLTKCDEKITKPHTTEVRIVRKTVEPLKMKLEKKTSLDKVVVNEKVKELKDVGFKNHIDKATAAVKPTVQHSSYSSKMLDQIEDIDNRNESNPQLVSIYIKDIYSYLNELERKYRIHSDHLSNQEIVTGKMRALLVDWLTEVHVQFALLPETFQLAVGIIDRYLQEVPTVKRNDIQLIGVSAVFIASKYEEIYAPDIGDFVYVSDNAYKKRDILKCEREILRTLNFSLGAPIPLHFLRRFIKAANGTVPIHVIAKYFIDLCLVEYGMCRYLPSEIAAGSLLLSMGILSKEAVSSHLAAEEVLKKCWSPTLRHYTGYHFEGVLPISMRIAALVRHIDKSKYQAVYKKYLSSKYGQASLKPELKLPFISELAKPMETS